MNKIHDTLQVLVDNKKMNIFLLYQILKVSTRANNIDLFMYQKESDLFIDHINNLKLRVKYLNKSSVIGKSFSNKKPYFIQNILDNLKETYAYDNPYKIEITNQIVLPIVDKDNVVGIIRLSQLPLTYTKEHFMFFTDLHDVFIKVFKCIDKNMNKEEHKKEIEKNKLENYDTIQEIIKLYVRLSENRLDPELEKLIRIGKENITSISTYLNPSLEQRIIIQDELRKFKITTTGISVLVVDDVYINVKILKAILSNHKEISSIYLAYDSEEADEILNKHDGIEMIFLDHHMPGKNGTKLAKELKNKNKNIYITSITNDMDIIEKYHHVYDSHIQKPFTKQSVYSEVEKANSKFKPNRV